MTELLASGAVDDLLRDLDADKVSVRTGAVTALTTPPLPGDPVLVLPRLIDVMTRDTNENVRSHVVGRLGVFGAAAVPALLALVADSGQPASLRVQAAVSLGKVADPAAIEVLAEVLAGADDLRVRHAALAALERIGGPDAARVITQALARIGNDELRARAVMTLRGFGPSEAAGAAVEALLDTPSGPKSAAAAVRALPVLLGARAVPRLTGIAATGESAGLRRRAVEELASMDAALGVVPLCRSLLLDTAPEVRAAAAAGLAALPPTPAMVTALLEIGREHRLEPADVDGRQIAAALERATRDGFGDGTTPVDHLVQAATTVDRPWPYLATLILALCGDSTRAGEQVNEFERRHQVGADDLRWLRIELGGQTALDPILAQLRQDLSEYFQVPVHKLNEATREHWERTLSDARIGFRIRMAMSVVVFIIGAVLVVASSWQFLFGGLDPAAAWGAGGSFVGGLGAMLLVVYSGPLRDIREAVADLATSNAIFIAYVHRVLQASHTFTALYLRERVTLDEAEHAGRLMQEAMRDSVAALRESGSGAGAGSGSCAGSGSGDGP